MPNIEKIPTPYSEIDDRLKRLEKSSGGGDNGGMDYRIGKLEGAVEQMDKRLSNVETSLTTLSTKIDRQLYFYIGGFAAMLLTMAKGFGWI